MRELKVRAWSPSKKYWREDWFISEYTKVLDLNKCKYDDDLILVQYTGLKDKNGKEIWEGDIIKKDSLIGKIAYEHNAFLIIWNLLITDEMPDGTVVQKNYEDVSFDGTEIIGNIYENPELLERKKRQVDA